MTTPFRSASRPHRCVSARSAMHGLASLPIFAVALSLPFVSCSGSTDGLDELTYGSFGESGTAAFEASASALANSTIGSRDGEHGWQLNREIVVRFTQDVDFASVSASSIRIVDADGVPALGTFSQAGPRAVRFQPQCPTGAGTEGAGLQPGRTYRLSIAAAGDTSQVSVLNTTGEPIESGLEVSFRTPASTDRSVLFHDSSEGAPVVRILGQGDSIERGTSYSHVEYAGDPDNVEYFRLDPADQRGEVAGDLPLNLYSDPAQQFAIIVAFDQPILATSANVSEGLIALEYYHAQSGQWRRVTSNVELQSNCSAKGATVRVSPLGVLPQGATMRVVINAGFQDLSGQVTAAAQTSFAVFQTAAFPTSGSLGQRNTGSDEILERFTIGGDATGSMEDTSIPSPLPRADWGGGTVTAGFDFPGTGGTNGDFDVRVLAGQSVFINTLSDVISGGPNGTPTTNQPVINGVLNVNDLTIEAGGRIVFIGPNTATILASGEVRIAGLMSADGSDNFGVGTLNTTNQPEPGASGQAGGGDGGIGSFLTSTSTPRGGAGSGAFNVPGLGGEGGETGYSASSCKDDRRGAGGGGGAFGSDVRYYVDEDFSKPLAICQMLVGLDGEPGFTGSPDGTGAVSQSAPAAGGALGPRPFTDPSPNNDFFGTMVRADGTQVRGELTSVWAGAGGGAGGDSSRTATFPMTPFSSTGDEKGAGGGGGAGGLAIYAVGDIVIESGGEVKADGGSGGAGENLIFFDRIGAGAGGGSGGHIVLSSASSIVVESEVTGASTGSFYRDNVAFFRHEKRPLSAVGGQGGAGREDRCGAGAEGDTGWRADAIPFEAFEGREDIPPYTPGSLANTFAWCNDISTCAQETVPEGTVISGGGDGAPGLIQLHVTDPDTQLVFGSSGTAGYLTDGIDVTRSMAPPPVGWRTPMDRPDTLVPFFSGRSESFSRWIPLGLASLNPDGSSNPREFFFEGTDAEGGVLRNGGTTAELAPVVPYTAFTVGGAAPSIDTLAATLLIEGASLTDPGQLYSRNPALLREFIVRFSDSTSQDDSREYSIVGASYDEASEEFSLALDAMGLQLSDDIAELDARPGNLEFEITPFYFRMVTEGVNDRFPLDSTVSIQFDATIADALTGSPSSDPEAAFSARVDTGGTSLDDKNGFTGDINALNEAVAAPGQTDPMNLVLENVTWDFVRFNVKFDIATGGTSPTAETPRPGLDFLRIPYRF